MAYTTLTHGEYSAKYGTSSVPCAAWHINYGGSCLNCGYNPQPNPAQVVPAEETVSRYPQADGSYVGTFPAGTRLRVYKSKRTATNAINAWHRLRSAQRYAQGFKEYTTHYDWRAE